MLDHRSYMHNLSICEIKAWKKIRPKRDLNPWPLRYRCSALPTELSSQLEADHVVSSLYTRRRWRMQVNTWKIIYLNCGERYEDTIDHRSYINSFSSCEFKAWEKIRPERDSSPGPLQYRCSSLPTELSRQLGRVWEAYGEAEAYLGRKYKEVEGVPNTMKLHSAVGNSAEKVLVR